MGSARRGRLFLRSQRPARQLPSAGDARAGQATVDVVAQGIGRGHRAGRRPAVGVGRGSRPAGRCYESPQDPHGGRLSCAVGAEKTDKFSFGDLEIQVFNRSRGGVFLGKVFDLDHFSRGQEPEYRSQEPGASS